MFQKIKKNLALICVLFFLPSFFHLQAITLIDLYDEVISGSLDIEMKNTQIKEQDLLVDYAKTQDLPTLNLTASGSKNLKDAQYKNALDLSVNYSINLTYSEMIEVESLKKTNLEIEKKAAQDALLKKIVTGYLSASFAQSKMHQLMTQRKWVSDKLARAQIHDRFGSGSKLNLHALALELSAVDNQIKDQESTYVAAMADLIEIRGKPLKDLYFLDLNLFEGLGHDVMNVDEAFKRAKANDPTLKTLHNNLKANAISLEIGNKSYLPSVSLFASAQGSDETNLLKTLSDGSLDLGWRLSMDVYDRGLRQKEISKLEVNGDQLQITLRSRERAIKKQLHTAFQNLKVLKDKIFNTHKSIHEAYKLFEIHEAKYQLSAVTISDLLSTRNQIAQLQNQLFALFLEVTTKELEIKSLTGALSRQDVLTASSWLSVQPHTLYQATQIAYNPVRPEFELFDIQEAPFEFTENFTEDALVASSDQRDDQTSAALEKLKTKIVRPLIDSRTAGSLLVLSSLAEQPVTLLELLESAKNKFSETDKQEATTLNDSSNLDPSNPLYSDAPVSSDLDNPTLGTSQAYLRLQKPGPVLQGGPVSNTVQPN